MTTAATPPVFGESTLLVDQNKDLMRRRTVGHAPLRALIFQCKRAPSRICTGPIGPRIGRDLVYGITPSRHANVVYH